MTAATSSVRPSTQARCELGEGPRFDELTSELDWGGIPTGRLLHAPLSDLDGPSNVRLTGALGAAAPTEDGGRVLAAAYRGLVTPKQDAGRLFAPDLPVWGPQPPGCSARSLRPERRHLCAPTAPRSAPTPEGAVR